MTGHLTTYGADAILAGTAMPTTLWVQFHNGDPGVDGDANIATEATRKSTDLGTPADGIVRTDTVAEWLNAAATETISHITLWDAETGGNPWWVIERDGGPLGVTAGETVTIDAGGIDLAFPLWGS